ncbi:hypothetical protein [Hymenobacter ruricola]|uniref:T9SS type A sorting domain-containing protein n=1 Tax=Hymenobacter ruricola TaxID=2791023 RepID=A0ABS0HZF5_9BACT|nr:hypothetical protein [Hymenobacter ruricola]MBF9219689.1 hypothetical protein [Hymenobacter ruricola]
MAYNLYLAPHVLGANSTTGNHYYNTLGWSMLQNAATSFSAAAWERWYLGWTELRTGPAQVSSDIGPNAPASGGTYVLRDYVTTGDVMRLEIPNTGQHLWLENRARNGPMDRRNGYTLAPDGNAYLPAPQGLLAMVESMSASRDNFVAWWNTSQVNGLRVVSAEGNFDYKRSGGLYTVNNHLHGNLTYNFQLRDNNAPAPVLRNNATGGHSEITSIRTDRDNNGRIRYDSFTGNGDVTVGNEGTPLFVGDDRITDGLFGPHIGTRKVGFRYALDTNPLIIPHQTYDPATERQSTIPLNGLSVEITGYDAASDDLTLQVRYDNTAVTHDTRWTGPLQTFPVANATAGHEIYIDGATLTLDRSATPQRETPGYVGDFVNSTELRIGANTSMSLVNGGVLNLVGAGTTLYLEDGAHVVLDGSGAKLEARAGTTINVANRADLDDKGALVLLPGSRLIDRNAETIAVGLRAAQPEVFPNPGTGAASFAWPAADSPASRVGYRYQLTDLQGHTLRQGPVNPAGNTLTGLAPGLYLLLTQGPNAPARTQRVEVR